MGQWYSLRKLGLEESLRVRSDFMMFTGFELGDKWLDETTLCHFRNKLFAQRLAKQLFDEINSQLQTHPIKVSKGNGAIVDATIIRSASRPHRVIEVDSDDNQEIVIKESKDPDARWLKKGNQSHFG